jgi:Putative 2OG-Fe(II) oxygenase
VVIGAEQIASATPMNVWPKEQRLQTRGGDRTLMMTRFEDAESYHPALIARVLELAAGSPFTRQYIRAFGGVKVERPAAWSSPEAALVDARAAAMLREALGISGAQPFESWANVYRRGDYSMPHSHPRARASVLYMLDPGDADPEDPLSGQFAVLDPRYRDCCQDQPNFLTNPIMPKLAAGSMLLFPGWLVHGVNPYTGARPRLTFTWNFRGPAAGPPPAGPPPARPTGPASDPESNPLED